MRNSSAVIFFLLCFFGILTQSHALENSTHLYREGAVMAMKGDIEGAIIKFGKAVETSPYYSLAHYGLGKAYLYKSGMLDEAIKHLRRAVELDHDMAKAYFYLGLAYLLNRKYVGAIHAFKSCYEADDTIIESLYNLAAVYDIIGKDYYAGYYFTKYYQEKGKEDRDILF
jgi:tetratricopeptide (TPR) repeat protein